MHCCLLIIIRNIRAFSKTSLSFITENIKENYCITDFLKRRYEDSMEIPIYGALAVILLLARRGSAPPRYDIAAQTKFVSRLYGQRKDSEFTRALRDLSMKFDSNFNGVGPMCMQSKMVGTDLLIALDLSTGQLKQDWWSIQKFIEVFISGLDIGPDLDQTRPAILIFMEKQFSVNWQVVLASGASMKNYQLTFVFVSQRCYSVLINSTQPDARRLTNEVFTKAAKMFSNILTTKTKSGMLKASNSRLHNHQVAKTLMFILNGPSHNLSLTVEKRKEFERYYPQVKTFAFGASAAVSQEELISIAGSRDKVLSHKTMNGFHHNSPAMLKKMSRNYPVIPKELKHVDERKENNSYKYSNNSAVNITGIKINKWRIYNLGYQVNSTLILGAKVKGHQSAGVKLKVNMFFSFSKVVPNVLYNDYAFYIGVNETKAIQIERNSYYLRDVCEEELQKKQAMWDFDNVNTNEKDSANSGRVKNKYIYQAYEYDQLVIMAVIVTIEDNRTERQFVLGASESGVGEFDNTGRTKELIPCDEECQKKNRIDLIEVKVESIPINPHRYLYRIFRKHLHHHESGTKEMKLKIWTRMFLSMLILSVQFLL
ncbi:uncharacterized protein LOC142342046 isoform X3 [Convolutriloba macropyga]|uniref:uncharacterized protein LOC142342046 isoform X3 n=1 Tax=Convolutriloba macropyga TaxID=536237 RepID=UPI003F51CBF8